MDPELAALLAQMEAPPAAAPPPAAPPPAEEAMDPELAALLAQLETPAAAPAAEAAPAAPAADAAMDPELAALLAQLEGGGEPAPAPAPEPAPAAPAEAMDPELAALMAQLEGGGEPAPAPAAEAAPAAAADAMDPELAALMAQLEGGAAAEPTAAPDGDLAPQIEAQGGPAALEVLGWPMFVPAFAEDLPRQLAILQAGQKNRSVEQEVNELVKKFGGYGALAELGVTADQGLNAQLAMLREIKKNWDQESLLTNPELEAMAHAYGANPKKAKSDEHRAELLARVKEYDRWASDARHLDAAAALEGTKFSERFNAYLELQYQSLGGDSAYRECVAASPDAGGDEAPLADKVATLRLLREFNRLGGERAYLEKAAGGTRQQDSLANKLEKLKAIIAAKQ
jgi:hypothetical protein